MGESLACKVGARCCGALRDCGTRNNLTGSLDAFKGAHMLFTAGLKDTYHLNCLVACGDAVSQEHTATGAEQCLSLLRTQSQQKA